MENKNFWSYMDGFLYGLSLTPCAMVLAFGAAAGVSMVVMIALILLAAIPLTVLNLYIAAWEYEDEQAEEWEKRIFGECKRIRMEKTNNNQ